MGLSTRRDKRLIRILQMVDVWVGSSCYAQRAVSAQGNSWWDVIFAPDGGLLTTSGCDATVMQWDVASGRPVRSLNHGGEVMAMVFSPDGTLLASAAYDTLIDLWGIPR